MEGQESSGDQESSEPEDTQQPEEEQEPVAPVKEEDDKPAKSDDQPPEDSAEAGESESDSGSPGQTDEAVEDEPVPEKQDEDKTDTSEDEEKEEPETVQEQPEEAAAEEPEEPVEKAQAKEEPEPTQPEEQVAQQEPEAEQGDADEEFFSGSGTALDLERDLYAGLGRSPFDRRGRRFARGGLGPRGRAGDTDRAYKRRCCTVSRVHLVHGNAGGASQQPPRNALTGPDRSPILPSSFCAPRWGVEVIGTPEAALETE